MKNKHKCVRRYAGRGSVFLCWCGKKWRRRGDLFNPWQRAYRLRKGEWINL